MVEHSGSKAMTGFALGEQLAHGDYAGIDLGQHRIWRQALRSGALGRLAAFWKVTKFYSHSDFRALLYGDRTGQWFSFLQAAFQTLHRSGVGEIKMFEHFGGAPRSGWMACEFLTADAASGGVDRLPETFQIRIHGPAHCSI